MMKKDYFSVTKKQRKSTKKMFKIVKKENGRIRINTHTLQSDLKQTHAVDFITKRNQKNIA